MIILFTKYAGTTQMNLLNAHTRLEPEHKPINIEPKYDDLIIETKIYALRCQMHMAGAQNYENDSCAKLKKYIELISNYPNKKIS